MSEDKEGGGRRQHISEAWEMLAHADMERWLDLDRQNTKISATGDILAHMVNPVLTMVLGGFGGFSQQPDPLYIISDALLYQDS